MAEFIRNMRWIAILVSWVMLTLPSYAQISVQQGVVTVSGTDPLVSLSASLINFGTIAQQGTLSVEGDLLNYGSYRATRSMIKLRGENQRIASDNLTVAQLHVENGGVKTLEGSLEVQHGLYLTNGLLRVAEPHLLTIAAQATITQNTEDSYVWGSISHRGNGSKFFPVGTLTAYAPLTLRDVRGDNPQVQVQYVPQDGRPYWHQTPLAGNYEGSTVTVTFSSQNPDYTFYAEQLTVTAGTTPNQTEAITSSNLSRLAGSEFTLSSESSTALPWISVGFATEGLEEELYVPNAFAPQAPDPEDRIIKVYGRYLSHNNFRFGIQDTWGRWVYQTTSLEEAMNSGWNTRRDNLSPAQFRYVVSGQFLSGNSFQRSDIIMKF